MTVAPGKLEHRSDNASRGHAARPHRRQFTARREGAQGEKAAEQHRGGHELQQSGWRGQQHVEQGVDQTIPPLTDIVELIDKLQQAEQRCQAHGHNHQSPEGGSRDVALQQAHCTRLDLSESRGASRAATRIRASNAGATQMPGNAGIAPFWTQVRTDS